MLKLNKKALDAKWYEYEEGVSFKLTPPNRLRDMTFSTSLVNNIVDWKGVVGEDDQPLECNEDNKSLLLGHNTKVLNWVAEKLVERDEEVQGLLKN
jgi:hypothetical protein